MADYPALPTECGSEPSPITKIDIDRAEDGTARARSFHPTDKHGMTLEHKALDSTDKTTLADFYTANRLIPFGYTSPADGVARTCIFAGPPEWIAEPGERWTAKVKIEET